MKTVLMASAWLLGIVAAGCGDDNGAPNVVINSPQAGDLVTIPPDNLLPISVTVDSFNLKGPTTCGSAANCGQVYINIDDNDCNLPGKAYNAFSPIIGAAPSVTTINADLSLCPPKTIAGNHRFSASLHYSDASTVIGAGNAPALAEVTAITTIGDTPTGGGIPPQ